MLKRLGETNDTIDGIIAAIDGCLVAYGAVYSKRKFGSYSYFLIVGVYYYNRKIFHVGLPTSAE